MARRRDGGIYSRPMTGRRESSMARDSGRRRERRTIGGLKQPPWRTCRNPYRPIEVLRRRAARGDPRRLAAHPRGDRPRIHERRGARHPGGRRRRRRSRHPARALRSRPRRRVGRQGAGALHASMPAIRRTAVEHRRQRTWSSAPSPARPTVSDLDRGRRPGSFADFCDLLRLEQSLDIIHLAARLSGRADRPAAGDPSSRCPPTPISR